jgi:hypothetical protein
MTMEYKDGRRYKYVSTHIWAIYGRQFVIKLSGLNWIYDDWIIIIRTVSRRNIGRYPTIVYSKPVGT